jgi:sRNA-binding regulator protein Hfq
MKLAFDLYLNNKKKKTLPKKTLFLKNKPKLQAKVKNLSLITLLLLPLNRKDKKVLATISIAWISRLPSSKQ